MPPAAAEASESSPSSALQASETSATTSEESSMPPWYSSMSEESVLDWFENSIQILTCDGDCNAAEPLERMKRLKESTILNSACSGGDLNGLNCNVDGDFDCARSTVRSWDYAKLHDEFIESLLQEQTRKVAMESENHEDDTSVATSSTSGFSALHVDNRISSSSLVTTDSSNVTPENDAIGNKKSARRKLLRRRSSSNMSFLGNTNKRAAVAPLPISDEAHPLPRSYLHKDCRLQKDQGIGQKPGSDCCTTGSDATLAKLQDKLEMLHHVSAPNDQKSIAGNASFKRKPAKIVSISDQYTETRSLIKLGMGFLRLQYGVLLRWEMNTGRIELIVLRKMCTDSFYKNLPNHVSQHHHMEQQTPEWLVMDGNHVVLQRHGGTEVALLEPPYKVKQPDVFEPSRLSAHVHAFKGLDAYSLWQIVLVLDTKSRRVRVQYDETSQKWRADDNLEWELPNICGDLDMTVEVFEKRRARVRKLRMKQTKPMPLAGGESRISEKRQLRFTEEKAEAGQGKGIEFTITFYHQSDYGHWLFQELEARKKDEAMNGFVWKLPVYRHGLMKDDDDEDHYNLREEEDEWFETCCSIC
mmetsp:Transcript_27877/g.42685  ORF Transcript_27877/g.42685 Transcript_27877/m.42685 type:complete len:585 (+) Transcript_27877:219-1973(+)|eukprot:CAMPEP_0195298734 /NCGR_PEP_ID=MMETSP0707-20130614/24101_1 /TAXON_ID=33640 /ORGANISM="Asterionellopsis glacialis, Strain CCMP134" /LENGTH=584 /DNA_ID=CAMNT_0040360945 /DNA_START=170 /DNA_END=1924 /DNA_ORIENTATION=+